MPIKVQLDVLPETNAPSRETEIPDVCPYCGQSFVDIAGQGHMLREVSFSSTTSLCAIDGETLDYSGSTETYPEIQYIVGYECANCDADLTPSADKASAVAGIASSR